MTESGWNPRVVECVLTTACHLDCSYCHQGRRRSREMSWPVLQRALERIEASGAREPVLALTGGEPLLCWSLVHRAVTTVRREIPGGEGWRISVTTNGLELDRRRIRFLAAHDVEVQISLDGVREAHDLRAPGTFDRLNTALVRMRGHHPSWFRRRVAVGMTLTAANVTFFARSVEYLVGMGVSRIRAAPLLTHEPRWSAGAEVELERQAEMTFHFLHEHFLRTGTVPLESFRRRDQRIGRKSGRMVCKVRSPETMAVGVDGVLAGCPLLLPHASGGTAAPPVLRTWADDPDWPGLRKNRCSGRARCRDCEFIDECLVCPVASAHIPGNSDPRRVPAFNCAFNRIFGAFRRRFPPMPDRREFLLGTDPLPASMAAMTRTIPRFGAGESQS